MQTNRFVFVLLINVQQKISVLKAQMTQLKIDNVRLISNNVFMIKKFKNVREYKKTMKMKRVDFEASIINSFHRFFSKESMNENVDNSKTKHSFLIFNDGLMKALKKIFRDICNNLSESSFFENDLFSTAFYA